VLLPASPSTVSNVDNRPQVVSQELRDRVLRAASELGYAGADPAARNLRSGRTGALGVVLRERSAYSFDDPAAVRFRAGHLGCRRSAAARAGGRGRLPGAGQLHAPAIGRAAVDGLIVCSLVGEDALVEAAGRRGLPTRLDPREARDG